MSKIDNIRKSLGGVWEYDKVCGWHCTDGRSIYRCSAGVDQFDNPIGPPQYWLYYPKGCGLNPVRAEKYMCNQEDTILLELLL